jgi:signal transduction histidine kinase
MTKHDGLDPPLDALFAGPGEMRALCRDFDWSATSLGPTGSWPLSLRTIVKMLLSSRHPMFLFWGPDLIQFYNDAYRPSLAEGGRHPRALGMRGAEFWTDIWDIIGPQIDQVMGGGEATWHEDHLVPIERNGRLEEVYWTYSYGPAYGDDLSVAGVLVVCQETTARVLTERRLASQVSSQILARRELEVAKADAERAMRSAESANRAKSEFLAVMSHELRTPLNAIAGYTELVEMEIHGPVTNEQREALQRIQRSERHLLGLVNGVLNYARLEAGNVDYELAEVDVSEALAECEPLVAPQARASKLELGISPCPIGAVVVADAEKLQQILLNLLSNAVKFTGPGGSITVTCEVASDTVLIHVRDTGRGIPPVDAARIFEPFVQVDTKLTRTREGVGLGLAISRDLARGMSGELSVVSEPGVGSTFTLTLPRAATNSARTASPVDAESTTADQLH